MRRNEKYVYIFNGFKYYIFSPPSIDPYLYDAVVHTHYTYLPQGAYHQGRQTATTTV